MADYITKDDLNAALAGSENRLENRLLERLAESEMRMQERLAESEMRMQERLAESEMRMLERMEKSETTLLREFHKWAQMTEARIRVTEFSTSGLTERMALLETRVSDLERR